MDIILLGCFSVLTMFLFMVAISAVMLKRFGEATLVSVASGVTLFATLVFLIKLIKG